MCNLYFRDIMITLGVDIVDNIPSNLYYQHDINSDSVYLLFEESSTGPLNFADIPRTERSFIMCRDLKKIVRKHVTKTKKHR